MQDNKLALLSGIGSVAGLVELDVSRNRIAVIGRALAAATSLARLNLDGNVLNEGQIGALADIRSLRRLRLSGNNIAGVLGPALLAPLALLTHLDVSGNSLRALGGLASRSLRALRASGNAIEELSFGDGGCPALESLELAGNRLRSLSGLAGPSAAPALQFLDVDRNALTSWVDWDLRSVRTLSARRNAICDDVGGRGSGAAGGVGGGHAAVVAGGPRLDAVETLALDHNEIADLTPLGGCTQLRRLLAGNNRLTIALPEVAGGWPSLAELDVRWNAVTRLGPAVGQGTPALVVLRVSHNALRRAAAVVAALRALRCCALLDTRGNPVTEGLYAPPRAGEDDPGASGGPMAVVADDAIARATGPTALSEAPAIDAVEALPPARAGARLAYRALLLSAAPSSLVLLDGIAVTGEERASGVALAAQVRATVCACFCACSCVCFAMSVSVFVVCAMVPRVRARVPCSCGSRSLTAPRHPCHPWGATPRLL